MNIELWNKGVDWIEEHPDQYDQGQPWTFTSDGKGARTCGSPCCFFGAVAILAGLNRTVDNQLWDLKNTVEGLLEITPHEADLVYASSWRAGWFIKAGFNSGNYCLKTPTDKEAIAILRGMSKEGRVWTRNEGE